MAPLAPCGIKEIFVVPLRSTKSNTHPEVSLISKQVVPHQTLDGTCCSQGGGESTPKNRSIVDSSKTNHEP
jgi:hypothetical protein